MGSLRDMLKEYLGDDTVLFTTGYLLKVIILNKRTIFIFFLFDSNKMVILWIT